MGRNIHWGLAVLGGKQQVWSTFHFLVFELRTWRKQNIPREERGRSQRKKNKLSIPIFTKLTLFSLFHLKSYRLQDMYLVRFKFYHNLSRRSKWQAKWIICKFRRCRWWDSCKKQLWTTSREAERILVMNLCCKILFSLRCAGFLMMEIKWMKEEKVLFFGFALDFHVWASSCRVKVLGSK